MKRIFFFFIFSLFTLGWINAQTGKFSIAGTTIDADTKTSLEQVTVQLLSLPDSSFVSGVVSLQDGKFSLSAKKQGKYIVKFSFVGYQTIIKPVELTSARPAVNIGEVLISPDAILLGEAVIVAEAPPVTMKEDTTIYSASAYRVAEGAMLEELVKKLPGAEVDKDGKITVNGKEIKRIMVDGKEFFSDDPKMPMKNLPANIVENVKAYEKKSDMSRITGIEDGEEEAVLDLTVKKGMKRGWIGDLLAGYGSEERYEGRVMLSRFLDDSNLSVISSINNTSNTGFSEFGDVGQGLGSGNAGGGVTASRSIGINYAKDKKNVQYGGNIQYGYSDNDARRKSATERFLGEEESSYENSLNTSNRKRHDLRADLRFEWRIDSMTTLIFRPNVSYAKTDAVSNGDLKTFDNNMNPVNEKMSDKYSKSNNYTVNGRIQFFRKLNNKGRNFSLSANLGYNNGNTDADDYSSTVFYLYDDEDNFLRDSISIIDRTTDRLDNNTNYRISASYTEPVFKNHYLQMRYQFSHRNSLVELLAYDNLDQENEGYVDSLSNRLEKFENNHEVELSLRGVHPKMMYNIGIGLIPQSLRNETTIGPNSDKPIITKNVLNFSPNVMLRYMFSKQHILMLRYRGGSSTPNIEDLQTVIDQTDPLNIRYGNPNLKSSFNNNLTLFYNNYISTSMRSYSLNLSFSNKINSVANKMTYNPETGGTIYERVNVNGSWNARSIFTFNTPFKNKKYTIAATTGASFSNAVSYTSIGKGKNGNSELSNTRNLVLNEKINGNYRNDILSISLDASVNYNLTRNDKQRNSNRETFDYYLGGSTNVSLPWHLEFVTNINYRIKDGYSGDFDNNEIIWNAQLSKNFLRNNNATIRFKIYDILRQQSNLSRSISETRMTDTEYNTLGSYFMVHFVYRLNTLGSKARSQQRGRPMPPDGGPPPRDHGGRRGGGFGPPIRIQ